MGTCPRTARTARAAFSAVLARWDGMRVPFGVAVVRPSTRVIVSGRVGGTLFRPRDPRAHTEPPCVRESHQRCTVQYADRGVSAWGVRNGRPIATRPPACSADQARDGAGESDESDPDLTEDLGIDEFLAVKKGAPKRRSPSPKYVDAWLAQRRASLSPPLA